MKNWCPQLAWKFNEVISPKIWIKSKSMKINDVFDRFTPKAYSTAISNIIFPLYQLKVPKQLTWKYPIWLKIEIFWVSSLSTKCLYKWKILLIIAAFQALDVKRKNTSLIFICFDLFWLDSNLRRIRFIELSSELGTPILDRFQKNFGFCVFSIRSFKFLGRRMVSFRWRTV